MNIMVRIYSHIVRDRESLDQKSKKKVPAKLSDVMERF